MKIVFDCENPACETWWEEEVELIDGPDEGRGMQADCFCPKCGWRPNDDAVYTKVEAALEPAEPDWEA